MKMKWRHWLLAALMAVGSVLAAWSLSNVRFFQILNLKAYDAHFIVRNALRGAPPIPRVVLLMADQKATDKFPELMLFWNKYYATAIQAAGENGAKVIGLDLAFGTPIDKWEPGADELLGGALSTSKVPVVVGYVPELNTNPMAQQIPINMMAAALGLNGFPNLTADSDDFVRNQELMESASANPADASQAHSLAMRVVEKYLGADVEVKDGHLTLQGHTIPSRTIAINYAGGPGTFPMVSLADFVAAAEAKDTAKLRKWVDGKIVLVGVDSKNDRFNTPFYTLFNGDQWRTDGVEVHANTIRTLLQRAYLAPVAQWGAVFALILVSVTAVWLSLGLSTGRAAWFILLQIAAILVVTHLFFEAGLILSTSELMLATLIGMIASITFRISTAEKSRNLFHRAIGIFVGRQLVETLEESEAISLTGKRLDVTILFTDIRGFTAFSEDVCEHDGPEKVVLLLNEYMAEMCKVIVKYHGHVNKFIGDGILAVFSDDDENCMPGDHAVRSVKCATEMVTLKIGTFKTGAGIHSGPAVVGNVGSADKMEYTVLGDTVNLASRLESLNKEHHTKLLMSGATQALLGDKVETTHLAEVPVRGKTVPIHLYTVTSLVEEALHA